MHKYTKWSIKNANGDEIYAGRCEVVSLERYEIREPPMTAEVYSERECTFANADTTGKPTFWIDDIKLEKVQIEEIEEEISFVDEKFDAADLSGLNGWSGAVGGVSIDNGTLKMPQKQLYLFKYTQ